MCDFLTYTRNRNNNTIVRTQEKQRIPSLKVANNREPPLTFRVSCLDGGQRYCQAITRHLDVLGIIAGARWIRNFTHSSWWWTYTVWITSTRSRTSTTIPSSTFRSTTNTVVHLKRAAAQDSTVNQSSSTTVLLLSLLHLHMVSIVYHINYSRRIFSIISKDTFSPTSFTDLFSHSIC